MKERKKAETNVLQFASLKQIMDHYRITIERDQEQKEDPRIIGSQLANSTIDDLLRNKGLT